MDTGDVVRTQIREDQRLRPWRLVRGLLYLFIAATIIANQTGTVWLCLRSGSMVSTSAELIEPIRFSDSLMGKVSRHALFTPRFKLRYRYEVDGQTYESTRLTERGNYAVLARSYRGPRRSFSESRTGAWLIEASERGRARVYYDPASPSTAVGVRDPLDAYFFVAVFVLFAVVLGRAGIRLIMKRHDRSVSVSVFRKRTLRRPNPTAANDRCSE